MKKIHQISRSAEFESLAIFREFIDVACQSHTGIADEIRYDLKLAVDEACTNIITHGYAGMNPGSIIFTLELDEHQVLMTITDFGHSFEPSQAVVPDVEAALEDRPMGGFGLYFIYQTMDNVDYEANECGNRLTLLKHLHKPVKE